MTILPGAQKKSRLRKDVESSGVDKNSHEDVATDSRRKASFKEKVLGFNLDTFMDEAETDILDGEVSDDDPVEEESGGPWFSMGMSEQEKIEARRPWRWSLIIKLVGTSTGYHYLLRRLQALWKTQTQLMLIDLTHDFYIARFSNKQDYEAVMLNGPWVINDHYLHLRRWEPNFVAKSARIESLLVWVRFPILPVEYFNEYWLMRAGNRIGRTVKVDRTTLLAARGKFARVCVEVDLTKPLKSGYMLRGKLWPVQYEGLHELCFTCGRYGHTTNICPTIISCNQPDKDQATPSLPQMSKSKATDILDRLFEEGRSAAYGEWMTAMKPRRRQGRGNSAREGGQPSEAVIKTTNGLAKNQTTSQGKGVTNSSNGSCFDVLTDLEEEPGCGEEDATASVDQSKQNDVVEAVKKVGSNNAVGQLKGKEKVNELNTAASDVNLMKDIRPLVQDCSAHNKFGHTQTGKKKGPLQPMKDSTNLTGRSINKVNATQQVTKKPSADTQKVDSVQPTAQPHFDAPGGKTGSGTGWCGPDLGRPPDPCILRRDAHALDPFVGAASAESEVAAANPADKETGHGIENVDQVHMEVEACDGESMPHADTILS